MHEIFLEVFRGKESSEKTRQTTLQDESRPCYGSQIEQNGLGFCSAFSYAVRLLFEVLAVF